MKYYDQNTNFLGAASAPPYAFIWTNAPPGMNYVSARAVDDQGVDGAPLTHAVFVEVPDTHVWFYSQFASNAGLILQSDAVVTNGLLRVSQAHNSTDGGAWLAQRAYVAKGFDSIFQFQIKD